MITICSKKALIIFYICLNVCSSLKIPYVRIGDNIILLNKYNNNEINTKSEIANTLDGYDKSLELIKVLLKLFMENRNKQINPPPLKLDNKVYTQEKNIKNVEVALRGDFDTENLSNDDKENNAKSSEEINEEKTFGPANDVNNKAKWRYTSCYGKRSKCVRACKEAYEDACYKIYCPGKLKNKLRRFCKRECIAWF